MEENGYYIFNSQKRTMRKAKNCNTKYAYGRMVTLNNYLPEKKHIKISIKFWLIC